jgi:SlyX protein
VTDSTEALLKRIEELESQLAFQDKLYETLNSVVTRQDGEILELKRQLKLLSERLKEIDEMPTPIQPGEEIPPHY